MLVIFAGPSCVGKTTLINACMRLYGWRPVRTWTTRPLKPDDIGRHTVGGRKFQAVLRRERNVVIHRVGRVRYMISLRELHAAQRSRLTYAVDLSPSVCSNLLPLGRRCVIVLPQDIETLRRRIQKRRLTQERVRIEQDLDHFLKMAEEVERRHEIHDMPASVMRIGAKAPSLYAATLRKFACAGR